MRTMKRALASILAGAVVMAAGALGAAEAARRGKAPPTSGSVSQVAQHAITENRGPAASRQKRLETTMEWVKQAPNDAQRERHLARLQKFEQNRSNAQRSPINQLVVLKWVGGAAVALVAFHLLPMGPILKVVGALVAAVGGAIYVPPALDAWRAGPAPGGGPRDWWADYKVALKAHKKVAVPHLIDWSKRGLEWMTSGLDKLAGSLTGSQTPAAAAATATTTTGGGPS